MAIAEWDNWLQPQGPGHFTAGPLSQPTHRSSHSPATLPCLPIPHYTTTESKPWASLRRWPSPAPCSPIRSAAGDGRTWQCRGELLLQWVGWGRGPSVKWPRPRPLMVSPYLWREMSDPDVLPGVLGSMVTPE